jgi:hypothetical protein
VAGSGLGTSFAAALGSILEQKIPPPPSAARKKVKETKPKLEFFEKSSKLPVDEKVKVKVEEKKGKKKAKEEEQEQAIEVENEKEAKHDKKENEKENETAKDQVDEDHKKEVIIIGAEGSEDVAVQIDPILVRRRKTGEDKKYLEEKKKRREARELALKKKMLANKDHHIPEFLNEAEEVRLRKLATKGVVQLFNAVRKQQKQQQEEEAKAATKDPEKIERLSKAKFLELLQKTAASGADQKKANPLASAATYFGDQATDNKNKDKLKGKGKGKGKQQKGTGEGKKKGWDVLQDDFLNKIAKSNKDF